MNSSCYNGRILKDDSPLTRHDAAFTLGQLGYVCCFKRPDKTENKVVISTQEAF